VSGSAAGRFEVRGSSESRALSKLETRNSKLRAWLVAAGLAPSLLGCSWFTDFKDQPKIEPWESTSDSVPPRGNPQNSVPVQGTLVPGFLVSRQPLPATIDSMATLANPVSPDARSLENGRKLYQINCAVCHGANGSGAGPAVRYGMAGIALANDHVRGLSDGYIWGMIRNGRGLMPSYNRIEELERWDVVNYVRGLQGRYAVDTTMARPGVTGDALPGASLSAPTRPAPFFNPLRPATAAGAAVPPPRATPADTTAAPAPGDTTTATGGRRP
jgi:mono/diheme cytochrome c family protein